MNCVSRSQSDLEQMLAHVVAEVLQQSDFLRERFGKHLQRVEVFGAVSLDVLRVAATTTMTPTQPAMQTAAPERPTMTRTQPATQTAGPKRLMMTPTQPAT